MSFVWQAQGKFPWPVKFSVCNLEVEANGRLSYRAGVCTDPFGLLWVEGPSQSSYDRALDKLQSLTAEIRTNNTPIRLIAELGVPDEFREEGYCEDSREHVQWTAEEGAAVLELIHGQKLSFAEIATKLYPRSEADVTSWYAEEAASKSRRSRWRDHEKVLLKKLQNENREWEDIARYFPGRTARACKDKWDTMRRKPKHESDSDEMTPVSG